MSERKPSGGELRTLMDYEEVVDGLKQRPGQWFRVFVGPWRSCETVRGRLREFGCVVYSAPAEFQQRAVFAFWPDWEIENETSSVWE